MSALTQPTSIETLRSSNWFHVPKRLAKPKLRLFCFPYAGGSAGAYHGWADLLPDGIELCAIQLPGRGNRFKEQPYTDMESLVSDLLEAIAPVLDVPHVFFGHSMGAQVAFQLIHALHASERPVPQAFIASGRRAPHIVSSRKPLHTLPEDAFIAEIARLNGTPKEALANPELMALVSPALRADCQVIETHQHPNVAPLTVPIMAVGGTQDINVSIEDLEQWSIHTQAEFSMQLFSGDHFFIHSSHAALLQRLCEYMNVL